MNNFRIQKKKRKTETFQQKSFSKHMRKNEPDYQQVIVTQI